MNKEKEILKLMTHVLEDISVQYVKPKKRQEPQIIDSDITSNSMFKELYPTLALKKKRKGHKTLGLTKRKINPELG